MSTLECLQRQPGPIRSSFVRCTLVAISLRNHCGDYQVAADMGSNHGLLVIPYAFTQSPNSVV
eukprot:725983-Amphidinium_carterae.3